MKFSIVIPVFNNLEHTISCIAAVRKHTKNYELIIVDDCSTDSTKEFLFHEAKTHDDTHILLHEKNLGFSHSVNSGIQSSKGDFIVLLNNDVIVTPGWADSLFETFSDAEKEFRISGVGMVGPVSNFVGGEQMIQCDKYSLDQLDESCIDHRKTYSGMMSMVGFLSGFCVMIKRQVFSDVGLFDTCFNHGFWEDNDFCLRAQLEGYKLVIDHSTFVHHTGSVTFKNLPYDPQFLLRSNQLKFYSKYFNEDKKTLTTVIRSHNQSFELRQCIQRASDFSDKIIVLLDRCTDDSYEVCKGFSKVERIIEMTSGFNEPRDHQLLLNTAVELKSNWILSLDSDEIPEDAFTYDLAHKLMNPLDPQILAYGLNFKTFFLGTTHYRTDGVFGQLWGTRFWRVFKNQKIQTDTKTGLHCTHGPPVPQFNIRRLRIRVKHYGYDSLKKCDDKFNFYSKADPDPDLIKTSPEGYNHIVSNSISVNRWIEINDITLCMVVQNEETNLFTFLSRYASYFDDIVIVDMLSTDKTRDICKLFNIDVYPHRWKNSFSEARNFAKSKCTTRWILSMDPDEVILEKDISTLWDMIEENVHGWLFKFANFQKDNTIIFSDNVRLFRNIPEIYWSWYCHENMAPSITKNKLTVLQAPFTIQHLGFLKTGGSKNKKLIQYGKLLQKQIRDFPNEALGYFHFAFHKFEEGKEETGMELLKKSASLNKDFFLAYKELGLRSLKASRDYFKNSLDKTPQGHYYHKWLKRTLSTIDSALAGTLED